MILGIIIEAKGGKGVLLLQHKTAVSLSFVIDEYIDTESVYPLWLAEFNEDALIVQVKERPKLDDLIGRVVKCEVKRKTTKRKRSVSAWLATMVELVPSESRHWLPSFKSQLTERRLAGRRSGDRASRRVYRKSQGGKDNIKRPWRG